MLTDLACAGRPSASARAWVGPARTWKAAGPQEMIEVRLRKSWIDSPDENRAARLVDDEERESNVVFMQPYDEVVAMWRRCIAHAQPLKREIRRQCLRARIRKHSTHLLLEHGGIFQLALYGDINQLIVGDAAPQEK